MDINLLPEKLQDEQTLKHTQFYVNVATLVILGALLIAVVVTYIYRFSMDQSYKSATEEVTRLEQQVQDKRIVEGTLKGVQLKLAKIREVLAESYPYGQIMEDLELSASDQLEITEVEVVDKDHFIVSGSADSLPALADYLALLDEQHDEYNDLRVTTLRFKKDDFRFDFSFLFDYIDPAMAVTEKELP